MSSLLEEAIVDAKALKEAALKNAEDAVLEKYSLEVKSALSTLLEQEELDLGADAPMDASLGLGDGDMTATATTPADTSFLEETPFAFQNEELDAPAEDELVEIDFNQLKARLEEEEEAGDMGSPDELMGSEEVAMELQEDGDITNQELQDDAEEDTASIAKGTYVGQDVESGGAKRDEDDLDEEIDLSEEMIDSLVNELLKVDMQPELQGWSSLGSAYNSTEQANNDAMAAASAAHLEEEEELEEEADTVDIVSDAELYEAKIKNLNVSVKELKSLLQEAKVHLRKMNLANAKLVYQNKALGSTSLNERQKNQVVEAVSHANSVEEAKVMFETIQNAAGAFSSSSNTRARPQTLREAVSRHTSILLSAQSESKATVDPRMDRMLRLAGLD
jgi:hypothetical protein